MTIRVVLADDHALLRNGLRALLALHPDISIVGEARTGYEAQRLARELEPDIILMDVAMPDMNGIEAARIIHERHPSIRILMLSMHATAEYVYRAFSAGARGYLLKDMAGDEVVAAVRLVHQGKRYLSSDLAGMAFGSVALSRNRGPVESLSARERQVLQLVVEGHTSSEIARLVHLSPKSVETYRVRLMKKLGVNDVPALVKFALAHGLTSPQ